MLEKKAKIISVCNQKGGVGKTTSVINLASSLAILGHKILIIDLDPQGNASTSVGIEQSARSKNIYHVLIDQNNIKESVLKTNFKNLDIISSSVDLSAAEIELLSFDNKEFKLKKSLEEIEDIYNFVIIDCPPSFGQLTINALAASNMVLIPMQCEFFALEGLSHLMQSIKIIQQNINYDLKILGVILTMYDKRNKLTEHVENDVREVLGDLVFNSVIPRNVRISEAPSHGMPVIQYDSNCQGSKAYQELAKELLNREKKLNLEEIKG